MPPVEIPLVLSRPELFDEAAVESRVQTRGSNRDHRISPKHQPNVSSSEQSLAFLPSRFFSLYILLTSFRASITSRVSDPGRKVRAFPRPHRGPSRFPRRLKSRACIWYDVISLVGRSFPPAAHLARNLKPRCLSRAPRFRAGGHFLSGRASHGACLDIVVVTPGWPVCYNKARPMAAAATAMVACLESGRTRESIHSRNRRWQE